MVKNFFYSIFKFSCNLFAGSGFGSNPLIARFYHLILPLVSPRKIKIGSKVFYLDKNDSLALSVFPNYEPSVGRVIKSEVKPGMTAIDIGAHIGYFTLLLADKVGPKGKIYAFEANPENFRILVKNIKANRYKNIEAINAAVSSNTGTISLFVGSESSAEYSIYNHFGKQKKIQVKSWDIDNYFKNKKVKVNFVKLDIQGGEGDAISGMQKTIKNSPQIKILTELWPEGLAKSKIGANGYLDNLQTLGFKFSIVRDKIKRNGKQVSVNEVLKDSKKFGYINVFCFRR